MARLSQLTQAVRGSARFSPWCVWGSDSATAARALRYMRTAALSHSNPGPCRELFNFLERGHFSGRPHASLRDAEEARGFCVSWRLFPIIPACRSS